MNKSNRSSVKKQTNRSTMNFNTLLEQNQSSVQPLQRYQTSQQPLQQQSKQLPQSYLSNQSGIDSSAMSASPLAKKKKSFNSQSHSQVKTITSQRCMMSKLGLKLDPICQKKGHEKGKIQFICMANECVGEKRLACAHCVIEDHQDHVYNKLKIQNYCSKFEQSFKRFSLQVNHLEELETKLRLPQLQKKIVQELESVQNYFHEFLEDLKEKIIIQVTEFTQVNQQETISFIQDQKQLCQRVQGYVTKNLFEMTSQELEASLSIMGQEFNKEIDSEMSKGYTSLEQYENVAAAQWTIYKSQIDNGIDEFIRSCKSFVINENYARYLSINNNPGERTLKLDDDINYISPMQIVPAFSISNDEDPFAIQGQFSKSRTNSPCRNEPQPILDKTPPIKVNQASSEPYQRPSVRPIEHNYKSNLGSIMQKQTVFSNVKGSSNSNQQTPNRGSPLRPSNTSEILKPIIVQSERSVEKIKSFPFKRYICPCHHTQDTNTVCIFKCCNQAYPCQQCHDLLSSHKAQISIPSTRYCMRCLDIFQVNQLSTVKVNCHKCPIIHSLI